MIKRIRRNILRQRQAPYARLLPFASLNLRHRVDLALTGLTKGLRVLA